MSTRKTRAVKNIAKWQKIVDSLEEAIVIVAESGVEAATMDTGTYGARQHVKNLDPVKMAKVVTMYETKIDRAYNLISGTGLARFTRKRYG